jgi:mono/diheme cytochrome c family protein
VIAVVAILALPVLGGAALLYREAIAHGFSAREKPWAIEEFVARRLRKLATGSDARRMMNPHSPSPEILAEARDHFAEHCALCHADDGSGKTEIGEGMYPPASDLRQPETQELTDGELFQIIRNGIRFTGMPGWGDVDTDEEIWELVLFVRHLPDLSAEELEHMRDKHPEDAAGGHHYDR